MDKKRSPWLCFIWQDIRQLLGSAKFYVVVAVVVVGMLTCFGGIRDYLRETGDLINPLELYVVSISNRVSLWIIYVGAVVLVCDAPFRYKGDIVRIVRTSRKMWLTGQVSFSCICILLYQAILLAFFFLLTVGHWDFSPTWSETIVTGMREGHARIGIAFGIQFLPELLELSPLATLAFSFILQFLMGAFSATVLALTHIKGNAKVGLVLCAVFPLLDYLLLDAFDFPWCRMLSYVISPFSLSTLLRLRPIFPNGMTFVYASLYFSFAILWLLIWMYAKVKNYDFFSVE